MKKVIVGSTNPIKLNTVKEAFAITFPNTEFDFVAFAAPSLVPDQPVGQAETKLGATNRALACKNAFPEADFFIGLEGGLELIEDAYWASAWMCITNTIGTFGFGRTGAFLLPPQVSERIKNGEELGIATDVVFNEQNSKHKEGTIGILTNGNISRKDFYRDAVLFALIPFVKPELY